VSWAFDTPFKWTKQVASHFAAPGRAHGDGMAQSIRTPGGIRIPVSSHDRYSADILEATGVQAPVMVKGMPRADRRGQHGLYSTRRTPMLVERTDAYFEMFGNRAIYHDGWIAANDAARAAVAHGTQAMPDVVNGYKWELYNIADDYSEDNDLAAKIRTSCAKCRSSPGGSVEIQRFPLYNSILSRFLAGRDSTADEIFSPILANWPAWIRLGARDHCQELYDHRRSGVPQGGGEGMIVTDGGRFGGYGYYLLKGKPVFTYNFLAWSARAGRQGRAQRRQTYHRFDFKYDGPASAKGGTVT